MARWVWPIEAAASGSVVKLAKAFSTGSSSSRSSWVRIASGGSGRTSDWRVSSSSVSVVGRRSVRVEAICPNFTNIPPESSSTALSRRAKSGVLSAAADR